jgi:hypothetical protein
MRSGMALQQFARADIALHLLHFREEGARPEDGIAAPAVLHRHHDVAARRIEGGNQAVDVGGADQGHVAQHHHHRIGVGRQRPQAGAQRRGHAAFMLRVVREFDVQPGQCSPAPNRRRNR